MSYRIDANELLIFIVRLQLEVTRKQKSTFQYYCNLEMNLDS